MQNFALILPWCFSVIKQKLFQRLSIFKNFIQKTNMVTRYFKLVGSVWTFYVALLRENVPQYDLASHLFGFRRKVQRVAGGKKEKKLRTSTLVKLLDDKALH